jgi:hypothetical protein
MKILGKTEDGYILEAHSDEVANLIGYYSKYNENFKVQVGDEIRINEMYHQLYTLQHKQPELQTIVSTLKNLADLLEPVCPVIENVMKIK